MLTLDLTPAQACRPFPELTRPVRERSGCAKPRNLPVVNSWRRSLPNIRTISPP